MGLGMERGMEVGMEGWREQWRERWRDGVEEKDKEIYCITNVPEHPTSLH